jgi:hypothetical protein
VSSGAKFGGAGFLEFENDNVDVLRGVFFTTGVSTKLALALFSK